MKTTSIDSKKISLFILISIYTISGLYADTSFFDLYSEYQYYQELTGQQETSELNYFSFSSGFILDSNEQGVWQDRGFTSDLVEFDQTSVSIIPAEIFLTYNSSKAYSMNDGAFWQGRGVNARMMGGMVLENDWLQLTLLPEIWGSQNQDFDIINTTYSSGYGGYWQESDWDGFDNLQRYGDEPFYYFNFGQSGIRLTWNELLTLGFTNENIIIGPGRKNNILLGNNASGFPHFDFGTDGRVPFLNWGDIDVRVMWGWLHESEYFDTDASNDYGWFSGMYAAWSPSFYPGFTLGLNHQYYQPNNVWDALDLIKFLPLKFEQNSGSDPNDAMISVSFDWHFPEVGLNVYVDWGRNDNIGSIEGLVVSPEHTQGVTIGLSQELYSWIENMLVFSAEISNLEQERTWMERPAGPWYRHGWAGWIQGYTNEGQLMGAAIGPGSNSQWAQLSWLHTDGMMNLFFQRIAHDKDYYYNLVSDGATDINAYAEVLLGIEKLHFIDAFELYGNVTYSYSYNFNFENNNDIGNLYLAAGFRYKY